MKRIEKWYETYRKFLKNQKAFDTEKLPISPAMIDYFTTRISGEGTAFSSFIELIKGNNEVFPHIDKIKRIYFVAGLCCAKEFPEILDTIFDSEKGFQSLENNKKKELKEFEKSIKYG